MLARSKFPRLKSYYKGKGCPSCQYAGYRGQVGVYEFLQMDTKLRRLIAKNITGDNLWDAARESGVKTLFENAWAMVEQGLTTVDEVIMKIPYKPTDGEFRKRERSQKTKVLEYNVPKADSKLIRKVLEAEGYVVASASGADIVEETRKEQPDVILVNASPDWANFVKQLRSDIRYVYIPVIMLSEKPSDMDPKDGMELGIKGVLSRPIDPDRLLELLRRGNSDN